MGNFRRGFCLFSYPKKYLQKFGRYANLLKTVIAAFNKKSHFPIFSKNSMNQTECSYCGAVVTLHLTNCKVCGSKLPENHTDVKPDNYSAGYNPGSDFQTQQARHNFRNSNARFIPLRCVDCGLPAPNGKTRCFKCNSAIERQANSKNKSRSIIMTAGVSLTLLLAAVVYFYYDFSASPNFVIKKYEKTTGVDKSLVYKNYVLTGNGRIVMNSSAGNILDKNFIFNFTFENPNKYSAEYTNINLFMKPELQRLTILKQVFDGISHTQFNNFKGDHYSQNSTGQIIELPVEDASNREMRLGLTEYESVELLENEHCKGIDAVTCATISGSKSYKVDEKTFNYLPAQEVQLRAQRKDADKSLKKDWLVFDGSTGLLVSELREGKIGDLTQDIRIEYKEYQTFKAPAKGFFGAEYTKDIKMPSVIVIKVHVSGQYDMTVNLEMEKLEFNHILDDETFQLPMAK